MFLCLWHVFEFLCFWHAPAPHICQQRSFHPLHLRRGSRSQKGRPQGRTDEPFWTCKGEWWGSAALGRSIHAASHCWRRSVGICPCSEWADPLLGFATHLQAPWEWVSWASLDSCTLLPRICNGLALVSHVACRSPPSHLRPCNWTAHKSPLAINKSKQSLQYKAIIWTLRFFIHAKTSNETIIFLLAGGSLSRSSISRLI